MGKRSTKKKHDTALFQKLPGAKHRRDQGKTLANLKDVHFTGGYKGVLTLGEAVAELRLGVDGDIDIRADAKMSPSAVDALQSMGQLPGNLRYIRDQAGMALLADTQIDGEAHLPETFLSIRSGMIRELQGDTAADPDPLQPPVERETVQEALAGLPWDDDGVVEQEDRWELRPRLRGDAVPVRMTIDPEGLRLSRVVLHEMPAAGTPAELAVADQAVRINARLRLARLAVSDGRLVAETRLGPWLIQPGWLATTACAVAVAARYAAPFLRLLAEQPAVVDMYIAMSGSSVEQPSPEGVGG